jgi:hypothetical protein
MGQSTFFVVVLTILALAANVVPAAAQSPYSYPWCQGQHVLLLQQLSGMHDYAVRSWRLVYAQPVLPWSGSSTSAPSERFIRDVGNTPVAST